MAYSVAQRVISKKDSIYDYCDDLSRKSKLLYNASLFRIRNIFTGYEKEHLTSNEAEVFGEVKLLHESYPGIHVQKVICYKHLEKLMRVTENPDFFAGLPMQTAQAIVKQAVTDFNNWLKSLKAYAKHPEDFLGRPKMPHYKKDSLTTVTVTNQDAVLYPEESGVSLKLPLIKERILLSNISGRSTLKEIKIKPYYGRFLLCLTMEEPDITETLSMPHVCAIDFGTDNFAAIVCDDHSSAIYKDLSFHHANFTKDQCHKISRNIIDFCLEHQAGTLILGVNPLWKQRTNMGTASNQKFVAMPISILRTMISYKALNAGIRIIEQEESYTSKADITMNDYLPTYGKDDNNATFSGARITRGLYRCADGTLLNADCNAAANIMRKAIPDIWKDTSDYTFLSSPKVYGFHELNPKSIPVKRIVA